MVKEKTVFFCLCFCHLVGVFADELKSVSVMEGDSVTLKMNVTEIQKGEKILWKFGTSGPLIAKTDGVNSDTFDGPDGIFRDRLKLDKKTGSLNIMNIRTEHAGVYEAEISRGSSETKHRFNVTVYDAVKKGVMEGESVTLNSGLTGINELDMITWRFGPPETTIAQIYKEGGQLTTSDVPDERFRDRLKLDEKTGSLTIMNTRTEDSGDYQIIIKRSSKLTTHNFSVTVYVSPEGHAPCIKSVEAVLRLVATALMGVASAAAAVLLVNDVRASRSKTEKKEEIS